MSLGPASSPGTASGANQRSAIALPEAPVLVAGLRKAAWLSIDGELMELVPAEAARLGQESAPVLCHAKATARRLGCDPFPALDLLELFAFVRPAGFCTPTVRGLATALGLAPTHDAEAAAGQLREVMRRLLAELAARGPRRDPDARAIAWTMARAGWRWGPAVLSALGVEDGPAEGRRRAIGLRVWERLSAWSEEAPVAPPGTAAVAPAAARRRLAELLGSDAEPRPQQADYASAATQAFAPREMEDEPNLVLAEAGTGVGKTLGYIAPASLCARC